ncbi:MAG: vitamin B12-dependent ribonucleotide reductase [bacterium]
MPTTDQTVADDSASKSSTAFTGKINLISKQSGMASLADVLAETYNKATASTIKYVLEPNGSLRSFDQERIFDSLIVAMELSDSVDRHLAQNLANQVVLRLVDEFDGKVVPRLSDIKDRVNLVLLDNNLLDLARAYIASQGNDILPKDLDPHYNPKGLTVKRFFTVEGIHPYGQIEWEQRSAVITNEKGEKVFSQEDVEAPKSWSQSAVNIVVSKYFRGKIGTPGRETSIKQMIDRVAKTISAWGRNGGYFASAEDASVFEDELTFLLVNQYAAFNSPVWFNVGVEVKPQCSACFINKVDDNMRSILNLAVTEGMLFKGGSGSGANLSCLRSSKEHLRGSSGKSSGPVSFMKGLDAFAGVIKSGGKTRRAAKMVILNIDHPDILEFIDCKAHEEKKAWALMDAGYGGGFNGEAYSSIFFQNANNSVRVTDEYMKAVEEDKEWKTKAVTTGDVVDAYNAKEIMNRIAEAAWLCGDPGLQYDTAINDWHTCPNSGRINGSNPCSEYMFLDDTACNLASLNLMKFRKTDGSFDVEAFKIGVEVMITAQEITVDYSSYPTDDISRNSHLFRPLGMGYANLGALLMARGIPYDSEAGRNMASVITSLMTGHAYYQSAKMAKGLGTFREYIKNRDAMIRVINKHRNASYQVKSDGVAKDLLTASREAWDNALNLGTEAGYKNSQVSLLAPTGTIGFLMDCDTTGVEPDIALVKYKWLVGGGLMKLVNTTVPEALQSLGYDENQIKDILSYINQHDTIEGAPNLRAEHLLVFDCAFKPQQGNRTIHYLGHIRMMAAVQPFLSGAISKTVNMPQNSTLQDIIDAYMLGWRSGLKALAVYRDGSKRLQPLTTGKSSDASGKSETKLEMKAEAIVPVAQPVRRRLPAERQSLTHKFSIAGHDGYLTVGMYDDGKPGEIFVRMSKAGSVISGLMESFAIAVSLALQYGVPLKVLVNKFSHVRFEPSGYTTNPQIRIAKSIVDYIFRWLASKFLPKEDQVIVGVQIKELEEDTPAVSATLELAMEEARANDSQMKIVFDNQADAPVCDTCGSIMVRNASCYKCLNCGSTSGCS